MDAMRPLIVPSAPRGLSGTIRVPPSKSITQRALLAAALAGGGSRVAGALDAEDPRLLFAALVALGFQLDWRDGAVTAHGRLDVREAALDLGNNGTGMRFLLAQLAAMPGRFRLDGSPRLRQRPVAPLVAALRRLGAEIMPIEPGPDRLPLVVLGRQLVRDAVHLDAAQSSQFVSALLFLGATLPQGLAVHLDAPPPSRPYLDLTAQVLASFSVAVDRAADSRRFTVRGALRPSTIAVEGDWSAAAFPAAGVALAGGEVMIAGVRDDSSQGDAVVLGLLASAGCGVRPTADGVSILGPACRPLQADLRDTPDLFPALAVVVARHGGRLDGLAALAVKESDRLGVMVRHLRALGYPIESTPESFWSSGSEPLSPPSGPALDPAGDHRIAMAIALAGLLTPGLAVQDPGCVAKSWPEFWPAWRSVVGVAAP
jgi:3-phosphoshikimate 1-carboxyvinyltransferase